MIVLLSDGTRVGIIDGIRVDDAGKRTSIVVLHGRLMKRKTLVDGKLVDFVDDDLVILSIDSQTFKSLRDVQPSSPRTRV